MRLFPTTKFSVKIYQNTDLITAKKPLGCSSNPIYESLRINKICMNSTKLTVILHMKGKRQMEAIMGHGITNIL